MPSFVLTLKLDTQKHQEDILNKRLELGRQIYNACLRELYKRYRTLQQSKKYRKVCKMNVGKERNKLFYELNKEHGLTEYSLHKFVKPMQHHFIKNIDSNTAQKVATKCFNAFQNLMFHKVQKIKFKKYRDFNCLEGKTNKCGLRFRNNLFIWNGLIIPVIIKKKDIYTQMALENKIKYCSVVRKVIHGRNKFYIRLVMEGVPPIKINKETGEIKHPRNEGEVGIDIGIQTIGIVSEKEVKLLELAPSINHIENEKRILQRKLDRQRRANNPHKFNEDGTVKRGNKQKWIHSKNYTKTKNKLANLQHKVAAKRKQDHEKLANWILSLGSSIKVESMNYKQLQSKAKQTTVNKKTGKYNKKKRFGKSISNKAPSMFLTILNIKLKYIGKELKKIDNYNVKASQYNHITDECIKKKLSERWNDFGVFKIQRDLYSAFLIMNVKNNLKEIDRNLCFETFEQFKQLHDLEIERLKNQPRTIASMGI